MTIKELYAGLITSNTIADIEKALSNFEKSHGEEIQWVPVGGKRYNSGVIETSGDPGRAFIERVTNAIDAVLENEHARHGGKPDCRSPKEAAASWLNIPIEGLSKLSAAERRRLSQHVQVKLMSGEARESRTIEIRDKGIGLTPEEMPSTILSLNEGNKIEKHYLVGVFGQGGSSTFAVSRYSVIASKKTEHGTVGFTIVRYEDLPPEKFKRGQYVYLTLNGHVPEIELDDAAFPNGTLVRHLGYDLSQYSSPVGPSSVYGLLNQILFYSVLPIWLDSELHGYRRVTKGSGNALKGAVDEGDEDSRGPDLSHHVPLFYVEISEFGRIGIEYWLLAQPLGKKQPSKAFVDSTQPIILTVNGQNHAELRQILIRKDAELPYLSQRLICHIDCDSLTARAKRLLFTSSREDAREGIVLELIKNEIIKALKSDDELRRLNIEARNQGLKEHDEGSRKHMRKEVARLLKIQGFNVNEAMGGQTAAETSTPDSLTHPKKSRTRREPTPIELHEPPTYIKILWDEDSSITFYPQQRRYLRIETDAQSTYHNHLDLAASKINVISEGGSVTCKGSTPLKNGRMRVIIDCGTSAKVGDKGTIRVELSRAGLSTLTDSKTYAIIEEPPVDASSHQIALPDFDVRPVSPDDPLWTTLNWPENVETIASSSVPEEGKVIVYYSTVFPEFQKQREVLEKRDTDAAKRFTERYEIWLALHSLLIQHYQEQKEAAMSSLQDQDSEIAEKLEQQERCRMAILSSLIARREIQMGDKGNTEED